MYSFRNLTIVLLSGLLLAAAPAFADIVHLKDGGQIEGKVISENETEVQLATKYGVQSIPMEQVKSIEKTPTIREIYRRKLDELQNDDPDSHYQLGLWCKEQALDSEAKLQFREALKLDPDHHGSRVELGYVFYGGKWVHTDEISELIEQKGYVVHNGRLMTKEEYDELMGEEESTEETAEEIEETEEETVEETEQDDSVPWSMADEVSTSHYSIKTNVGKDDSNRYKKLLEELHDEYSRLFRGFKPKSRERMSVWIFRNQEEFMQNTGRRADVGGYYDEQAKRVLTYKGLYGSGTTDPVLAHQCCYQYLDTIMNDLNSAPAWIIEGFAVYFEAAEFTKTGGVKLGKIPRDRLIQLKAAIADGNFIPVAQLIRRSRARFGPVEQAHAWSLIYFMEKRSSKYGKILSEFFAKCVTLDQAATQPQQGGGRGRGRGRQRTNLANDFEQAIGDLQAFEDEWKSFISGLEVPPAGDISGNTFTSENLGFEVTKPSDWAFVKEGSAAGFQAGAMKGNSRFEVLVYANSSNQDSKTYAAQYKRNIDRAYAGVESNDITVAGKPAVEIVYSDESRKGGSSGTGAVYKRKVVVLADGEKIFLITFEAFAAMYEADVPDFDKVVESFKLED